MSPSGTQQESSAAALAGLRVVFVGKLASMSRRDAAQLAREHGAVVVEQPDASVHLAVIGEEGLPEPGGEEFDAWFDEPTREAVERGTLSVITETQLWQRLGLVEPAGDIHRLYTPAMLADLLGVSIAVVRRWHRRGLIRPVREVRRLPYFDFSEVTTARRLAELLAAGVSPAAIERKLATLAEYLPDVERPLAQLSVIVEGRQLLLRQGDGLIEPGGQRRFDFDATGPSAETAAADRAAADADAQTGAANALTDGVATGSVATESAFSPPTISLAAILENRQAAALSTPEQLLDAAAELEDDGQLHAAAEMYRAAMAAGRPRADACFLLAELLYRLGDLPAARERYYTAVEIDEDFVEARANLGCVLAEQGERELALAAFEGALRYHPDYADVHYHMARALDDLQRRDEAEGHWRRFLELAADSPWADQAHARLGC